MTYRINVLPLDVNRSLLFGDLSFSMKFMTLRSNYDVQDRCSSYIFFL